MLIFPALLYLFLAMLFSASIITGSDALSLSSEGRQFIEISNPLHSANRPNDRLPVSFVADWPTWVLEQNDGQKLTKIPADTEDGFVSPTSVDELWLPVDLKQPQCKLALGLHVRDGVIRHILPAVDLSYDGQHRNRGLCSVPRAYNWIDFPSLMMAALTADGGVMRDCSLLLQTKGEDDEEWRTMIEVNSIEDSVNSAIQALAGQPPKELGDGSSLIHVVCEGSGAVECPKPGCELRSVLLLEKEGMDGCSIGALHVQIKKTAAGSDSEFLPDVYKPLFGDKSLRRPSFIETKKRMGKRE
jgi:hypothetical protein